MSASIDVTIAGERLRLLADRAAVWPARDTLIVADVHLGKESVFGRAGLAVPGGATEGDLDRLSRLVREHAARRVVVLGDLVHGAPTRGATWPEALASWLDEHPDVQLEVAAGNHDRPATRHRLDARIAWHAAGLDEGPFSFVHEPERPDEGYALAGHLHPVIRLAGGGDRVRCPVFWFTGQVGVLPAFGRFTGGYAIRPGAGDHVFAAGPGALVEVPGRGARAADRPWSCGHSG